MKKSEKICVDCGTVENPKASIQGSFLVELMLWFLMILPGLIYSIWRFTTRAVRCQSCGSKNLISTESPRGRALVEQQWGVGAAKIVAALVLIAFTAGASFAGKDKDVVVKTDKFTGKTSVIMTPVELKSPALGCFPCLNLMATEQDGHIQFIVISNNPDWLFLNGADVHVLADGKPLDLGHFVPADRRINTIVMVTTSEYLTAEVQSSALAAMANAGELEIEVGSFQCKVKPKNARKLKEFSDSIAAVSASK